MAMWNRCAICGRAIPVGELCYGIKNWHGKPTNGDTICKDCLVPENALTLTPPNEAPPVLINDEPDREYIDYICPRCKNTISQRRRGQRMETVYQCKYHDNCGQRVDWENPQPYRRPPEGEEKNVCN